MINIPVSGNGFFADYCFPFAGLSPSLSRDMHEVVVVVVVVVVVLLLLLLLLLLLPSSDPASFAVSLAHLDRIFRAKPTMISQKDIAAWRDSELETCTPTDWYFADYCFPSRTHRGSFADILSSMLKPFYIIPTQGPLDQSHIYILYIYIYIYILCIYIYIYYIYIYIYTYVYTYIYIYIHTYTCIYR